MLKFNFSINFYFVKLIHEVSEKLPKTTSETSDFRDYKKITQIIPTTINRCNLN